MTTVKFISQQANGIYNDCGEACCMMLMRAVRFVNQEEALQYWVANIDPQQNGSTQADLIRFMEHYGFDAYSNATDTYPRIALINTYQDIPPINRANGYMTYEGAHWLVRLSPTTYYDPLYTFDRVLTWLDIHDHVRYATSLKELITMSNARIPYDRVMHVVATGSTQARYIEICNHAYSHDKQSVSWSYDDAGIGVGLKSKLAVLWDIPTAKQNDFITFYRTYYPDTLVNFTGSTPTPPNPPTPIANRSDIGYHLINTNAGESANELKNWAVQKANEGCNFFVVIDDSDFAKRLADIVKPRDGRVVFRWYHNYLPTNEQMVERHSNAIHTHIIHSLFNEGDVVGCWNANDYRERCPREAVITNALLAKGAGGVAIGGISQGNPDLSEDTASVIRQYYTPLFNSNPRVYVDYHSYSPTLVWGERGAEWYETRYRWLIDTCGLTNTNRFISVESGVDASTTIVNKAGFKSFPASQAQFNQWCKDHLNKNQNVRYAALFCGNKFDPRWSEGFDVTGYQDSIVYGRIDV